MYQNGFPKIKTLDDVLPAIKDREEFIVADKGAYKVVNYVVNKPDTFAATDELGMMRRECRGIVFDAKGNILSRPLHKFFNVNEREETLAQNIPMRAHVVLDKLDGSMVRPLQLGAGFRLATKMGITDTSMQAEQFVGANMHYMKFFAECYEMGYTPIFEWCSPVEYDKHDLILIAMRDTISGDYYPFSAMDALAQMRNISVVNAYHRVKDIHEFIERIRGEKGIEGYIMRFEDGHMLKFKCEDYILLHRSKDIAQNPRHLLNAVLEESADDLRSLLQPDDLEKLNAIEKSFWEWVDHEAGWFDALYHLNQCHVVDKKTFAMGSTDMPSLERQVLFKMMDGHDIKEVLVNLTKQHTQQDKKFRDFVLSWGLEKTLFLPQTRLDI